LISSIKLTWNGTKLTNEQLHEKLDKRLGSTFKVVLGHMTDTQALAVGEIFPIIHFEVDRKELTVDVNYPEIYKKAVTEIVTYCRLEIRYRSFLADKTFKFETKLSDEFANELKIE
jgi:hypothetical protein